MAQLLMNYVPLIKTLLNKKMIFTDVNNNPGYVVDYGKIIRM